MLMTKIKNERELYSVIQTYLEDPIGWGYADIVQLLKEDGYKKPDGKDLDITFIDSCVQNLRHQKKFGANPLTTPEFEIRKKLEQRISELKTEGVKENKIAVILTLEGWSKSDGSRLESYEDVLKVLECNKIKTPFERAENTFIDYATYKNHPIFSINEYKNGERKKILGFGVRKAKLIIKHLNELKTFIDTNQRICYR